MLTLHTVKKETKFGDKFYNIYIGSTGNKFIFNVAPANESKPVGGYDDLRHICSHKNVDLPEWIVKRAEEIMGRTLHQNMATAK